MFPLVKAGHAEIALSDLEASSPSSMLQLSIEQSMMRGVLCTASTSSAALDSASPVTQGRRGNVTFMKRLRHPRSPMGTNWTWAKDQGRQKSIISAMSLYTEEESASIDLVVVEILNRMILRS